VDKLGSKNSKEPSLAFGGQALIEGVMMRSRNHMVLCVRKPNQDIVTEVEKLNPLANKYKALGVPFIRGIVTMVESFYIGMKGLLFSANAAVEQIEGEEGESVTLGAKELAVVALGTVGIVAFFFLAPFMLASWLNLTGWVFNVAEAAIRLTMFIIYLAAIASWGEFHRVLQYHGAEHKAINAHEAGVPLDVANVKKFSRLHPRCGTSFLFITLVVSIVLFSIMPNLDFAWKIAYRILLIPVIAGISYELLRLSGKYRNSIILKIFIAPGLGFQLLTTKEPTDDMLEVSIKAVQEVTKLTSEQGTPNQLPSK
jgi:uncharacterized protein YqhQ